MSKHIELLGMTVKDLVTGKEGVVASVSFDLYGCVQAGVVGKAKGVEPTGEQYWFDVSRLKIQSAKRVMPLPDFNQGYIAEGRKGPANKPRPGL